jgi:hypothetical protein
MEKNVSPECLSNMSSTGSGSEDTKDYIQLQSDEMWEKGGELIHEYSQISNLYIPTTFLTIQD